MKSIGQIYLESLDTVLFDDSNPNNRIAHPPERFLSYDRMAIATEKRGIDLTDFRELCKIFSEFESHVKIGVLADLRKLLPIERNDE